MVIKRTWTRKTECKKKIKYRFLFDLSLIHQRECDARIAFGGRVGGVSSDPRAFSISGGTQSRRKKKRIVRDSNSVARRDRLEQLQDAYHTGKRATRFVHILILFSNCSFPPTRPDFATRIFTIFYFAVGRESTLITDLFLLCAFVLQTLLFVNSYLLLQAIITLLFRQYITLLFR